MKVVGITGPIGSGKSLVASMAAAMGFPVFKADEVSRQLLELPENIASVKSRWGNGIQMKDGSINRRLLAEIVFKNNEDLKALNALIHPQVNAAFSLFVKNIPAGTSVFRETALLVPEVLKQTDVMLVVLAPEALVMERVKKRSGMTPEEYLARRSSQPGLQEYLAHASHVLLNNNRVSLLKQFDVVLKKIT